LCLRATPWLACSTPNPAVRPTRNLQVQLADCQGCRMSRPFLPHQHLRNPLPMLLCPGENQRAMCTACRQNSQ
jgi:hypothetical protein